MLKKFKFLNKQKNTAHYWIKSLNIKCQYSQNWFTDSKQCLSKSQLSSLQKLVSCPIIHTEIQGIQNSQSNLEKKTQHWGITLCIFKTYYKVIVILHIENAINYLLPLGPESLKWNSSNLFFHKLVLYLKGLICN